MPAPEMLDLIRSVGQTNEQIAGILSHLNDVPSSIPVPAEVRKTSAAQPGDDSVGEPVMGNSMLARRLMTQGQMDDVRDTLRTKDSRTLHAMFAKQAARRDTGVPLWDWLSADRITGLRFGNGIGNAVEPDIAKAIDTSGASALIRQDLSPIMLEIYTRVFPLFDAISKEPANGLVHAFNRQLSYGDADWIGELDTVTDDQGEYERDFTNIGILATRRGVSLKSVFAVMAGGMTGFNPERLEMTAGLLAMASRMQKTLLHGNWNSNTGTLNNEIGPYDVDSFNGLRRLLNTASAVNVDPATNPTTTGSFRRAFDSAILPITESGGGMDGLVIWGSSYEHTTWNEQQDEKTRVLLDATSQDVTVGVRAVKVMTNDGAVPFYKIPGGQVGSYVASGTYAGNNVRDMYVTDLSSMSIPYLGAESPTVLEIPIGVNGQLNHLFIIFFMGGFALKAPTWNNKIRVKV